MMRNILDFVVGSARLALQGGRAYAVWMATLGLLFVWGAIAYLQQVTNGLIVTNMRDQVSWAFYIGNFTFLVGVAAAAVMLVVPAYIYHWKPIKEIAIFGELLAISAIIMCLLFVTVATTTTDANGDYTFDNLPAGEYRFRAMLAKSFKNRYGWNITAENVALTSGSQNSFFMLFNLLADVMQSLLDPRLRR